MTACLTSTAPYDGSMVRGVPGEDVASWQTASMTELAEQQRVNEKAAHRVVGLVVETRPETLDAPTLAHLRALGCTKVQIGVQSLRPDVLELNGRHAGESDLCRAFELLRIFGFKIHTHFMANLYGSDIAGDEADYARFVSEAAFQPDEVKLYPCVLVEGTGLVRRYETGEWRPYAEEDLVGLLARDVLVTPPFTRVSRMIRDISAVDIMAGSKKTNLRQLVEASDALKTDEVREIRFREIAGEEVDISALMLDMIAYETTNTSERFLQWITPEGKIAGFLRLSLPHEDYLLAHAIGASRRARVRDDSRGARLWTGREPAPQRRKRAAPRTWQKARRACLRARARSRFRAYQRHQLGRDARLLSQARLRGWHALPDAGALVVKTPHADFRFEHDTRIGEDGILHV